MTGPPDTRHVASKAATLASMSGLLRGPQAGSSKPICMSITSKAVVGESLSKRLDPDVRQEIDPLARRAKTTMEASEMPMG